MVEFGARRGDALFGTGTALFELAQVALGVLGALACGVQISLELKAAIQGGLQARLQFQHGSIAIGELGRQPRRFARLVERHPDRVLFGTDAFPLDEDSLLTYARFLETDDECFSYAAGCDVPPQGRWDISGAALPPEHLQAVYADNARRLLAL